MAQVQLAETVAAEALHKIEGIKVGEVAVFRENPLLEPYWIRSFLKHIWAVVGLEEQDIRIICKLLHLLRCLSSIGDDGGPLPLLTEAVAHRIGGIVKCGEHGEREIINAVGLPRSYIDTLEKAFPAELAKVKVLGGEHRYSQPVGEGLDTCHMIPVYMGKKYVFYILDIEAERLCPAAELREGIAVVHHKTRFLSLEDV